MSAEAKVFPAIRKGTADDLLWFDGYIIGAVPEWNNNALVMGALASLRQATKICRAIESGDFTIIPVERPHV